MLNVLAMPVLSIDLRAIPASSMTRITRMIENAFIYKTLRMFSLFARGLTYFHSYADNLIYLYHHLLNIQEN